jgi:hypothetical protein
VRDVSVHEDIPSQARAESTHFIPLPKSFMSLPGPPCLCCLTLQYTYFHFGRGPFHCDAVDLVVKPLQPKLLQLNVSA